MKDWNDIYSDFHIDYERVVLGRVSPSIQLHEFSKEKIPLDCCDEIMMYDRDIHYELPERGLCGDSVEAFEFLETSIMDFVEDLQKKYEARK